MQKRFYIKGTRSDIVQVQVKLEDIFEFLKKEVFRPQRINFTAFTDSDGEIKTWEDSHRNNDYKELYETSPEQRKLIEAFELIAKNLPDETP